MPPQQQGWQLPNFPGQGHAYGRMGMGGQQPFAQPGLAAATQGQMPQWVQQFMAQRFPGRF
jgi:hypothetical protein